jgi:acyl dehydratase
MTDELAGSEPVAAPSYPIAEDQTRRYADASGDHNAFHLDDEVARAAGLPGIIVHGLCLMAFAGRAVLASQEIDDPAAIRRLAVRFSRPMTPGDALTTRIRRPENGAIRFDSTDRGGDVILKDGLAELGSAAPGT